jgi:hypothetical protein
MASLETYRLYRLTAAFSRCGALCSNPGPAFFPPLAAIGRPIKVTPQGLANAQHWVDAQQAIMAGLR